jgi:hypothetical protein
MLALMKRERRKRNSKDYKPGMEEYDEEKALKKTRLNEIMRRFLETLAQSVKKYFYDEYCVMVCLYRKGLNQLCWDCFKKNEEAVQVPANYLQLEYC